MSEAPKGKGFVIPYSKDYEDACFALWYRAGKPTIISKILDLFPKDDQGRTPSTILLKSYWLPVWRQRADVLDAESNNILDTNLIQKRVEMLEKQAETGQTLQKLGLEYFESHGGINDAAVALRAVVQGVEMERNSRGLSVALQRISSMSDETLQNELNKQLERYKNSVGEIVDGAVSEDDTALDQSESDEDA